MSRIYHNVAILLSLEAAHRLSNEANNGGSDAVAILLSLEAAHRLAKYYFYLKSLQWSQSYFHWKRLTDRFRTILERDTESRNPTFTGSGSPIK
jgi:hypothetical protein